MTSISNFRWQRREKSARAARVLAWLSVGAALVLVAETGALAQGCAMCAASMPGTDDPLSQGFAYNIYIFLGITYGLFCAAGGWIAYKYWRASNAPPRATRVLAFQTMRKEEQS